MNARFKKGLIIVVGVIGFLLVGALALNHTIEEKIKDRLETVSENVTIQYELLEMSVLKRKMRLIGPQMSVYGKTSKNVSAKIVMDDVIIDGFSYWDYLFNHQITIEHLLFNQPRISYHYKKAIKHQSYKNIFEAYAPTKFHIDNIQVIDGSLEVYNDGNDSLMLSSRSIHLKIDDAQNKSPKQKESWAFSKFNLQCKNLYYALNTYENLYSKSMYIGSGYAKFKGFSIKTKYSREALSKILLQERDHFNLTIDSVDLKQPELGYKQDTLFYFNSPRVDLYGPKLNMYRDKLVSDNYSYKPLYSKMLRDLPCSLHLNNVLLHDASITYAEHVSSNTQTGQLVFTKLQAKIKNLGNFLPADNVMTTAKIEAFFLDTTPLQVEWNFDVNNIEDEFIFKGEIGKINANSMNQFMEPNLNMKLQGEIFKTYFTIDGNETLSHIDLKVQYDDFNIVVLKDNGYEKNKLLSTIVNLFVSKDSYDKKSSFRHGSKSDILRNKHKSIFNYIWLNIKSGLMDAMTGNGKKQKNH